MKYKDDVWSKEFKVKSKKIAAGTVKKSPIDFGKEIYVSPIVFRKEKTEKQYYRWAVREFRGEYNVFIEKIKKNGGVDRTYAASFTWKETAIKFALEMLLICTKKMTRSGGIFH